MSLSRSSRICVASGFMRISMPILTHIRNDGMMYFAPWMALNARRRSSERTEARVSRGMATKRSSLRPVRSAGCGSELSESALSK